MKGAPSKFYQEVDAWDTTVIPLKGTNSKWKYFLSQETAALNLLKLGQYLALVPRTNISMEKSFIVVSVLQTNECCQLQVVQVGSGLGG